MAAVENGIWGFSKKLKIELLYDSAIQLLGIHPKELKAGPSIDTSTPGSW